MSQARGEKKPSRVYEGESECDTAERRDPGGFSQAHTAQVLDRACEGGLELAHGPNIGLAGLQVSRGHKHRNRTAGSRQEIGFNFTQKSSVRTVLLHGYGLRAGDL